MDNAAIGKVLHGFTLCVSWFEAVHGTPFESRSCDSSGAVLWGQTRLGGLSITYRAALQTRPIQSMGLPITGHTDCTTDMLADPLIEADVLTML